MAYVAGRAREVPRASGSYFASLVPPGERWGLFYLAATLVREDTEEGGLCARVGVRSAGDVSASAKIDFWRDWVCGGRAQRMARTFVL